MISLIWAQDENGLIGNDNRLPWQLPADMAWFKKQTMGKPVLMGRKTFESIGKPLPGRMNLILSRQSDLHIEGCTVVRSLGEAKAAAEEADEIMVIGGAEIYAMMLPYASRMYQTAIHAEFSGNTFFPGFDENDWQETGREDHEPDEKNPYAYSFITLERTG